MSTTNWTTLLYDGGGILDHVRLSFGANGQIALYTGSTQLGISAVGVVPAMAWCYVEGQLFCHDTAGTAIIRVNGATVLNLSGVRTKNSTGVNVYAVMSFTPNANQSPVTTTRWDDLYVATANGDPFLGDMKIETLYPNGNGTNNQWLGSDSDSVNNYLLVNEPGNPVTTTNTSDQTPGDQDMYTLTDLASTAGPIPAVCHAVYAAKSDTVTARDLRVVNHGSSDTKSAAVGLTTSYATYHYAFTQNPDTSAAWTIANVNSLQAGVETV